MCNRIKNDFIKNAINDTQATIRAIDTKLGALTAASLLPFSVVEKIWSNIGEVSKDLSPLLGCVLGGLFFTVWFLSLVLLVKTLAAIDNPACHIKNSEGIKGSYYSGGLFKFNIPSYIFSSKKIKSSNDISEQIADYPDTEKKTLNELAFEHMKLVYIRDIKLHRLKGSLLTCSVWAFLGCLIFILAKFF